MGQNSSVIKDIAQSFLWQQMPMAISESIIPFHSGELQGVRGGGTLEDFWIHSIYQGQNQKINLVCQHGSNLQHLYNILRHKYQSVPEQQWHFQFATTIVPFQTLNPLQRGSGIRHELLNGLGTFGGYVMTGDNLLMGLSNNHVIANSNQIQINGSNYILVLDSMNHIAGNLRLFVNLLPAPHVNKMDVGLFEPVSHIIPFPLTLRNNVQFLNPSIGTKVYKWGYKTGFTTGYIEDNETTLKVPYTGLGVLNFEDCLTIIGADSRPFSLPGDSGSLIFDDRHNVVGIVFAGHQHITTDGQYISYGNRADLFQTQLNLKNYCD